MKMNQPRARSPKRAFHKLRWMAKATAVIIVMLIAVFVYLRAYGVPGPLLRAVIRRANEAGIPVDVSRIKLTVHGWRADDVRYYSANPADTKPIFKTEKVYFGRHLYSQPEESKEWKFDIEALGVEIGPSVEWGVEIPEQSPVRNIESIKLSVSFLPDRIEFSDGTMHWLGSMFTVKGTIVKTTAETVAMRKSEPKKAKKVKQKTVSPVYVNKETFQSLEDRFNAIQVEGAATIDIAFHIDANDYSTSTLSVAANADQITVRGVDFSRAAISANYCYPTVQLEHMGLHQGGMLANLAGSYDLSTKKLDGRLSNTITSQNVLTALPVKAKELLKKLDMQFGQLPLLEINVGPCTPAESLNHISGTFSIQDFTYAGSTIKSLGGKLERKNDRLELSELTGTMLGLEHLAEKTGSGMLGGTASGSVYFDSQSYWFRVDADMNLDPTLLIGPLSTVRIATNVLHRFKFNGEEPPRGHLELGSCVTNWSTFFIDIQMTGNDVTVHEAEFSSVDISATYSNALLRLSPITALQGTNDLSGTVSINFRQSTAELDIVTSMQPLTLQDAAYPPLGVFGKSIKTSGKVDIKAKGLIDWKRMKATDFKAEIAAEQIELPVARLTDFTGNVFGKGPLLTVKDTEFTLYDGKGYGDVSITINPEEAGLPLGVDLNVEQVDLYHCLQFFKPETESTVSGLLAGTVLLKADLKENFFESAHGSISLAITKGQLADLPFLEDFTKLMRRLLPSFNVFSFTGFNGDFHLDDGVIKTEDSHLEGELISAKGHGLYSAKDGFDAYIQVQTFSDRIVSQVVRVVTDPILKLFEVKLEGPLSDPSWTFKKPY